MASKTATPVVRAKPLAKPLAVEVQDGEVILKTTRGFTHLIEAGGESSVCGVKVHTWLNPADVTADGKIDCPFCARRLKQGLRVSEATERKAAKANPPAAEPEDAETTPEPEAEEVTDEALNGPVPTPATDAVLADAEAKPDPKPKTTRRRRTARKS